MQNKKYADGSHNIRCVHNIVYVYLQTAVSSNMPNTETKR